MNKWLKYLVGISAIIIAGCAAFFSITGLGILFAGASVSVMVMAGSLEYAKLVTATYLKQKWDTIKGFNKWYLTGAVVILMAITSAGIFGYLSNAFQQQNIKLDQVQREIDVWSNKIKTDTSQIALYTNQLNQLQSNSNTVLSNNTNKSSLKFATSTGKEQSKIRTKISVLNDSVVAYNSHINDIKNNNISLEREVGGFRFVAEAFGMSLNNVVKFFIFLIVIVFDPLAIALVIAFNQLVMVKKEEEETSSNPEDLKNFVDETVRLRLSEEDLKKLEETLLNPPPPNEELKKAAELYKQKPWSNLPDDMWERMQKYEAQREAIHGPILPEDEPTGALANSGPREREQMDDFEIEEEFFTIEPTEEEEERNFFTITSNTENILQNEEETNKRMDIIGQNGNEGLHYEEEVPPIVKPRTPKHKPKFVEYQAPTSEENTEEEKKNL